MNEQNCDRPFAGGFFEFVCPAPIIGERLAGEKPGIIGRRFVGHHHKHFAFEVDIFIVVPLVLGSINAIADENKVGVNIAAGILGLIGGNILFARLQLYFLAIVRNVTLGIGLLGQSHHGHIM